MDCEQLHAVTTNLHHIPAPGENKHRLSVSACICTLQLESLDWRGIWEVSPGPQPAFFSHWFEHTNASLTV